MINKRIFLPCLAVLMVVHGTAQAQFGNIFGATKKNPGSVLPEWWNEREYIPETLDGALHIRMGSAGNSSSVQFGVLGRSNCDVTYLYAAKSGKALSKAEMEECALLEFHIKRGVDGDRRNVNDGFVKKEVIDEMTVFINQRIELFRNADKFYFRAYAIKVEPYDFKNQRTLIKVNWGVRSTDTAQYSFRSPWFPSEHNSEMAVPLEGSESLSREIEAARFNTGNSTLALATNKIVFSVNNTGEERYGSGFSRKLHIKFHGLNFRFYDAQRRSRLISIGDV